MKWFSEHLSEVYSTIHVLRAGPLCHGPGAEWWYSALLCSNAPHEVAHVHAFSCHGAAPSEARRVSRAVRQEAKRLGYKRLAWARREADGQMRDVEFEL